MRVDGKQIAEDILREVRERVEGGTVTPRLAVIACAPNFETQRYLELKKRKAESVSIDLQVCILPENTTTEEVIQQVTSISGESDGIVLQLPLPPHIDTDAVIAAIPNDKDVDALSPDTHAVLPPVAEACKEICARYGVVLLGKKAVVIGNGRLVGAPVARFLSEEGAEVSVVTKHSENILEDLQNAELIVSGAGDPAFLKPDMIKDGVVLLDAGTSEDGGVLRGDADPRCEERASLFTPVPGGIGPVTIAVLLRNLLELLGDKNSTGLK